MPMDILPLPAQPMQVTIDGLTGRVKAISNVDSNVTVNVDQSMQLYISSSGQDKNSKQCSGAYIFR